MRATPHSPSFAANPTVHFISYKEGRGCNRSVRGDISLTTFAEEAHLPECEATCVVHIVPHLRDDSVKKFKTSFAHLAGVKGWRVYME